MVTALRERKVFTVRDYHKMIDAGVFVGSVEGEIIKKSCWENNISPASIV